MSAESKTSKRPRCDEQSDRPKPKRGAKETPRAKWTRELIKRLKEELELFRAQRAIDADYRSSLCAPAYDRVADAFVSSVQGQLLVLEQGGSPWLAADAVSFACNGIRQSIKADLKGADTPYVCNCAAYHSFCRLLTVAGSLEHFARYVYSQGQSQE